MTADQLNITEVKHTAAYYDNDSTNFADIENGDVPSVPFREEANKLESDTDSEADADEEE